MFRNEVFQLVAKIPEGKVCTYGFIASAIGNPRSARQVGYALNSLGIHEEKIPWWRVVNKKGYLSIDQGKGGVEKELQRDLLIEEGVDFDEYTIKNLSNYIYIFPS